MTKFLEMTESTNSMRSVNSVGKVDFAWSGIVENLNGEILFASLAEFFEQSIVQSFRLVNTFSFALFHHQPVTLFLDFAIIFGISWTQALSFQQRTISVALIRHCVARTKSTIHCFVSYDVLWFFWFST
jgi:hypothetical protein